VACLDLDDPNPELLNDLRSSHKKVEYPIYRTTSVAGASTPTSQRIVQLSVNVPAPHLMAQGHIVAEWDANVEEMIHKTEIHRFVVLVFRQNGLIPPHHVMEHSLDPKPHRTASLPKFLHAHHEIDAQGGAWAGTFFTVDCQTDAAYLASKRVEEMMKPILKSPTLTTGVKHPPPKPLHAQAPELGPREMSSGSSLSGSGSAASSPTHEPQRKETLAEESKESAGEQKQQHAVETLKAGKAARAMTE